MSNFDETFNDTNKIGDIKFIFKAFEKYESLIHNGYYYIVGINHKPSINETVTGKDILISTIKLGDVLNESGLFRFYQSKPTLSDTLDQSSYPIEIRSKIEESYKVYYELAITYIILWCKENGGMPFFEDRIMDVLDDDSLHFETGHYGFKVGAFIDSLMHLHSNFYRWRYAIYNEKPDWLKEDKKSPKSFEWFLSAINNSGISYEVRYDEDKECFNFKWTAEDLFCILNFQLALLASRKDPDGSQIKRCNKCNNWFETYNGKQKYCGKQRGCNAKSVAQSRWRKK